MGMNGTQESERLKKKTEREKKEILEWRPIWEGAQNMGLWRIERILGGVLIQRAMLTDTNLYWDLKMYICLFSQTIKTIFIGRTKKRKCQ